MRLGYGCELLGELANRWTPLPRAKVLPELADAVDADAMTKLGRQRERLAGPLAALLHFAQLNEPGGEVGQGGTPMLLERWVERVEGPSESRNGVCWSAKLEVADTVIGLQLRVVERTDPNPGTLVVLVRFAESMAGPFERPKGSLRITRNPAAGMRLPHIVRRDMHS